MTAGPSTEPLPDRRLYRELFWPVLHALQLLGGSATKQEIVEKAVELGGYNEDEQVALMPNGRTPRLSYYCSWMLTRLKGIELAENSSRGVWALTERGREATEDQVPALWAASSEQWRRSRQERRRRRDEDDDEITDGDTTVDDWKDALLARLKVLDASAFERLIQRLLREADFEKVEVTGRSGDGGIDGVGLIKLGLLSFPTYFQCKRYEHSVGAGAVRDFRGAMAGRGEKGVLITTAGFTPAAREEATRDGVTPIDLIDGDELCDLLKRHRVGIHVTERTVEDVTVDDGFWDHFT
jgi:restriction system protein